MPAKPKQNLALTCVGSRKAFLPGLWCHREVHGLHFVHIGFDRKAIRLRLKIGRLGFISPLEALTAS